MTAAIADRPRDGDARSLARALHQSRLVIFDEEREVTVRWNGSVTFNVTDLDGEDIDAFTVYDVKGPDDAAAIIAQHLATWS